MLEKDLSVEFAICLKLPRTVRHELKAVQKYLTGNGSAKQPDAKSNIRTNEMR